jgi:hypothetical protein
MFKIIGTATLTDSSVKITSSFFLTTKMTRKQFYSNMAKLVNKTGLISRKNGYYILSNYGKVVFYSLYILTKGSSFFWALKALDNENFVTSDIPREQILEISARLIKDKDIQRIITEPIPKDGTQENTLYEPSTSQSDTRGY